MTEQWIVLEKALDDYVQDVHQRFKEKSDELTDAGLMRGSVKDTFIRDVQYLDENLESAKNYLRHTEAMARLIFHEK